MCKEITAIKRSAKSGKSGKLSKSDRRKIKSLRRQSRRFCEVGFV